MSREKLLEAIFGSEIVKERESDGEGEIFVSPDLQRAVSSVKAKEISDSLREVTEDVLSTLTPREKEIIKMRFGLDASGEERKRAEVGMHFNITGERIRQIEQKALRKLRHPSRSRRLRAFLEKLEEIAENEPTPAELNDVIETISKLTPELILHLKSHENDLEKMDPLVFEELVAEFLAHKGFQDVRLVGKDISTSADIYAVEKVNSVGIGVKYFIEVKREKNKIGVDVIDKVYGAMIGEQSKFGWNIAMIVSVSGFKNIRKYTDKEIETKGIYLKNQDDVKRWLQEYQFNKGGLWLPNPHRKLSG